MSHVSSVAPQVEAPLQVNIPWTESPFFDQQLAQSGLDPEMSALVAQFARDGFVIVDCDIDNFDQISSDLVDALAPCYQGEGRIQDAWRFAEQVRALAVAPAVLDLLRTLYRREPVPFQTLNFPRGTQQPTHSDCIHFSSVPERFMCGVWIALEDMDAENGPLEYFPGSHRLPVYDMHDLGVLSSHIRNAGVMYARYEQFIAEMVKALRLERRELYVRKGQALVWAANLLHGGSKILDANRTRHSQVTHYYFSECMYYTPLFSDPFIGKTEFRTIVDIRTGEVVPHYYLGNYVQFNAES